MANLTVQPLVAVINTAEEMFKLLEQILHQEGYRTVSAYVPDLKRGTPTAEEFLREHDPAVVLWDIGIPYEENWAFFQQVAAAEAPHGRQFVLTTTNRYALENLVGGTPVHELIGKPFDLEEICGAVRSALGSR
jgi:DNA-binding response OmpR family regulator